MIIHYGQIDYHFWLVTAWTTCLDGNYDVHTLQAYHAFAFHRHTRFDLHKSVKNLK